VTCKHCRQPSNMDVCLRCAKDRVLFVEAPDAGMIGNALRTDGYKGGVDTFYREPVRDRDLHHDLPIVLNGELHFQADPLVAVKGYAAGDEAGHRRVAREVSEREAERIYLSGAVERTIATLKHRDRMRLARERSRRRLAGQGPK